MATVTVGSLNLRYGLQPRSNLPYDLVAAAEAIDADVLVLEEVWHPDDRPSQAEEVADALGYDVHQVEARPGHLERKTHFGSRGRFRIAVLSRLPSKARDPLPIAAVAMGEGSRNALPVDVDVDGTSLLVVGAHIQRAPLGLLSQMRTLHGSLSAEQGPVAVLGDMNHWPPFVRHTFPGWRSAVRGRTWPASMPHSQIDHILVRGPVEVVKGEVVRDVGSDHRPVRALLALRPDDGRQ